jgi:hypothetical protein
MDIEIRMGQRFPNIQMSGFREWRESRFTGVQKEFRGGHNSRHGRPLVIDEIDLNSGHLLRSIHRMLRLCGYV